MLENVCVSGSQKGKKKNSALFLPIGKLEELNRMPHCVSRFYFFDFWVEKFDKVLELFTLILKTECLQVVR